MDPPLNFVPTGPIESALAETLGGVSEPAWVIDADRGAIVGANGRGGAVWGIPTISPVLDSVVPALRAIRSRFAQGSFLETTTSTVEPLKFWTTRGARTIACEVRTLDDSVSPGLLLVIARAAAHACHCASSSLDSVAPDSSRLTSAARERASTAAAVSRISARAARTRNTPSSADSTSVTTTMYAVSLSWKLVSRRKLRHRRFGVAMEAVVVVMSRCSTRRSPPPPPPPWAPAP